MKTFKTKSRKSIRTFALSGITILAMGLGSSFSSHAAHSLKGVVKDVQGQPIKNAIVELHGTRIKVKTDNQGRFFVDETASHVDELHVSAAGYNHVSLAIAPESQELSIILESAVIERIHVTATPLHGSTLESATPISVISDLDLKNKHASTLGETLKSELGVHSSYYGPVSSTPIIRGLDGPRVLIAQNGLDVGDASRVGPDHVVATETSTVKQIEVLRGPATLFYGSGAIGGVVNVVDNRVPQEVDQTKEVQLSFSDVSEQVEFSTALNGGFDLASSNQIAWHFDAFYRDSGDFKVPENPEASHDEHEGHEGHDDEHDGHDDHADFVLENSGSEAKGFNLGTSYIFDKGYVGVSVGQLERLYGIPGHAHSDEHDDNEGESAEEQASHDEHGDHDDDGVKGDMKQTRIQLISEVQLDGEWFTGVNGRFAFTDYEHKEIEGGEVGTIFENDSWQLRSDLLLADMNGWHGVLTFDAKHSDFVAIGEEAFSPPSKTSSFAVGLLEEKHFGDVLVQLGARIEQVAIEADAFSAEHHAEEGHDAHENHADEHGDDHDEGHTKIDFTPFSLSAGLVYDFAKGYNVGISFTHSSRAPSAGELFSFGPHIGTNSYEIGAGYHFEGEEHDGDGHHDEHEGEEHHEEMDLDELFHFEPDDLQEETSNNVELSLRKFEGETGFVINAFYNEVDNFYYQENTGLFFEGDIHGHHEEETEEEHQEHADEGLPVYHFEARDAKFYGIEAQYVWRVNRAMKLAFQADSITGKLKTGEYLPRIPPVRIGSTLNYDWVDTSLEVHVMHNFEQDKVAALETHTEAYTMVDVRVNHTVAMGNKDVDLFFKIDNLFNEAARVHTSFLKNDTLLPSRNITLGVRANF